MSVAFLFGTGASAFSGECRPTTPPIGKDLFAELVKLGGVAASVEPDWRPALPTSSLGWKNSVADTTLHTISLVREMAAYFASFSPGDDSCYIKLVRMLLSAPRRAVLATLNYDLPHDRAQCEADLRRRRRTGDSRRAGDMRYAMAL